MIYIKHRVLELRQANNIVCFFFFLNYIISVIFLIYGFNFLKLKYVSIDGESGRSNKLSFCDCRVARWRRIWSHVKGVRFSDTPLFFLPIDGFSLSTTKLLSWRLDSVRAKPLIYSGCFFLFILFTDRMNNVFVRF